MALPCFEMLLNRVLSLSSYEIILSYFSTQSFTAFFIEFIGVTLVNKIIQVSGSEFYNTTSVCLLCSLPQVKSPSITIYLPPIPSSTPLLTPQQSLTVVHVHKFFLFFFPAFFILQFMKLGNFLSSVIICWKSQ